MEPEQETIERYVVVHRSGKVDAASREVARVLGWIEVEGSPEMLRSRNEAEAAACAALGIDQAYCIDWELAGDDARRLALERGDVTKQK